ncbi:hypothetical protein EVAR_67399_1 [Eumeta japonica]|uniref:Uncharacterized protein n=1 Tax=Eumeta variegata TaxID=151549 RepID=A0A4C2A0H9_EUMVA|nr:hypothetical protein EVAR_67399_1 [Eumeta japonica]
MRGEVLLKSFIDRYRSSERPVQIQWHLHVQYDIWCQYKVDRSKYNGNYTVNTTFGVNTRFGQRIETAANRGPEPRAPARPGSAARAENNAAGALLIKETPSRPGRGGARFRITRAISQTSSPPTSTRIPS